VADRKASEERVIETMREWLPEVAPDVRLLISAADHSDPEVSDDAFFTVEKQTLFACSRGSNG
jgi:hypothetical protein